jgi:hypothetical protein
LQALLRREQKDLYRQREDLVVTYNAKTQQYTLNKEDIKFDIELMKYEDAANKETYTTALNIYQYEQSRMDDKAKLEFEAKQNEISAQRDLNAKKELVLFQEDINAKVRAEQAVELELQAQREQKDKKEILEMQAEINKLAFTEEVTAKKDLLKYENELNPLA